LRKSGEKGLEYYKLTLSSVFVLSSDQSFSGEDSGYEAITITARTTSMTYREQQENGTVGGETSRTISNCSTGNTR
jgi:type VI protein secretion system component Hcp